MKQRGFTLIEILVAMALGGLVIGTAAPAIFQVVRGSARSNGMAVALSDIDNAAHWLTRDVGQALPNTPENPNNITLIDGAQPVSHMTFSWMALTTCAAQVGSVSHSITYTQTGTELVRVYDAGMPDEQVSVVGNHLTNVGFSISGRLVTVTLTSSSTSFTPRVTETMTYLIYLRSG